MAYRRDCVFVFDFDGVIYDPVSGEPRSVGVEALREAARLGRVYIVTGRSERDMRVIREVLGEAGVRVPVIARPPGIVGDEVSVKLELWSRLLAVEECILEVHDDNEDVLSAARRRAIGALVLHHGDRCWSIRGRSLIRACNI